MGYVLSAYIVDQEKIAAAIGSGDEGLVSRVIRSNRDEFDDDEDFPPGSNRPRLRQAIQQLVAAPSSISDDPQYRYAFEELCRFLGRLSFADRYAPESMGLSELFDSILPFPIPNPGDLPRLAYLPANGVEAERSRVKSLERSDLEGSARELATAWVRCLDSAKRKRCGVVLTYG